MWLSKRFKNSNELEKAEGGSITLSSSETLEASSSMSVREISSYAPYGYSALLPVGENVMLVPSAEGQAIVGTKAIQPILEVGEIQIKSKGGATIVLKNDGSVKINSLIINKEGEIVK